MSEVQALKETLQELLSSVQEVNESITPKEELLKKLATSKVKDQFKHLMLAGADAAAILEKLQAKTNSIGLNRKKDIADLASDVVFHLYHLSSTHLQSLLEYADFKKTQISKVMKVCEAKIERLDEGVSNLFKAHSKNLPMIHYSGNRALLNQGNLSDEDDASNSYGSFIRYLLSDRLPSATLEMIARLDIYQNQSFEQDLAKYPELKEIYQTFCEKGHVKRSEMRLAQKVIEASILENLNENPIQFFNVDRKKGYALVKSNSDKKYGIAFLKNLAPSHHLDAWGVKDGMLQVHAVTTLFNFQSQDLQSATIADGILNGIRTGELKKVRDFKIHALCKALLSNPDCDIEGDIELKSFNKQAKSLLKEGHIDLLEFNALKYAPADTEILKLMVEKPDALYDQIKGKLSVGFHSDESHPLTLKDRGEQLSSSIHRLYKATEVLNRIGNFNPTLDQIQTAFGTYATDLSVAYTQARNAFVLYGAKDKNLSELKTVLDKTQKGITALRQRCVMAKITAQYPQVGVFISPTQDVKREKKMKNEQYQDEQSSIAQSTVTALQTLKEKTAFHNVDVTQPNAMSQILKGRYSKITQSLLVDAILQKIEDMVLSHSQKQRFHPASCNQLALGIALGQEKQFDLTSVYRKLQNHPPLLEKLNQDYASHLNSSIPQKNLSLNSKR